jgi:hypothetical protein
VEKLPMSVEKTFTVTNEDYLLLEFILFFFFSVPVCAIIALGVPEFILYVSKQMIKVKLSRYLHAGDKREEV